MEEVCNFLSSGVDDCDPECLSTCISSICNSCGEVKDFMCTDCNMDGCSLDCFPSSFEPTCDPFNSSCCLYLESDCLNSLKCDQATENLSTVIQSIGQAIGSMLSNFLESIVWLMPNNCLISLGIQPNSPNSQSFQNSSLVLDEISIQPDCANIDQ